jgi:hypothetical protein
MRSQRGQTSAEYMGVLLLVAVIIGALISSGIATSIADRAVQAVCQIAGECESSGGGTAAGADELQGRLLALAPLVNGSGGAIETLAQQAQAAIDRGDLDEARELIGRLEFYRGLFDRGPRGETLEALVAPGDADFADLVDRGTIQSDDDTVNRRYFQISPQPGQGIFATDLFIPGENAGRSRATAATSRTRCAPTSRRPTRA